MVFLGLLHLRIALLSLVLGGGGSRHHNGVNNGVLTHEQALIGQVSIELLKPR